MDIIFKTKFNLHDKGWMMHYDKPIEITIEEIKTSQMTILSKEENNTMTPSYKISYIDFGFSPCANGLCTMVVSEDKLAKTKEELAKKVFNF